MANFNEDDKNNSVKSAHLYFQGGQWDKAIAEYEKILNLDPDDMNIHNMLGDLHVKKMIRLKLTRLILKSSTI